MNGPINALSKPDAVNVAHIVERCAVLGPGIRFVVWTQGCPLRCPGCHNPQFQPFEDREWMSLESLTDRILRTRHIEGMTLVGGEPFAQSLALAALTQRVRMAGRSTMAYSGFTLEQLQSGFVPNAQELLSELDLLVDGPYLSGRSSDRLWRGSDNQRLICLSDRYRRQAALWDLRADQQFELRVSPSGKVEVLGIWPATLIRRLEQ